MGRDPSARQTRLCHLRRAASDASNAMSQRLRLWALLSQVLTGLESTDLILPVIEAISRLRRNDRVDAGPLGLWSDASPHSMPGIKGRNRPIKFFAGASKRRSENRLPSWSIV